MAGPAWCALRVAVRSALEVFPRPVSLMLQEGSEGAQTVWPPQEGWLGLLTLTGEGSCSKQAGGGPGDGGYTSSQTPGLD